MGKAKANVSEKLAKSRRQLIFDFFF